MSSAPKTRDRRAISTLNDDLADDPALQVYEISALTASRGPKEEKEKRIRVRSETAGESPGPGDDKSQKKWALGRASTRRGPGLDAATRAFATCCRFARDILSRLGQPFGRLRRRLRSRGARKSPLEGTFEDLRSFTASAKLVLPDLSSSKTESTFERSCSSLEALRIVSLWLDSSPTLIEFNNVKFEVNRNPRDELRLFWKRAIGGCDQRRHWESQIARRLKFGLCRLHSKVEVEVSSEFIDALPETGRSRLFKGGVEASSGLVDGFPEGIQARLLWSRQPERLMSNQKRVSTRGVRLDLIPTNAVGSSLREVQGILRLWRDRIEFLLTKCVDRSGLFQLRLASRCLASFR